MTLCAKSKLSISGKHEEKVERLSAQCINMNRPQEICFSWGRLSLCLVMLHGLNEVCEAGIGGLYRNRVAVASDALCRRGANRCEALAI